jgi:hypothetical protein
MDRQAIAPQLERFVVVDLSAYWNNDGISYAHNRADGWFNVWGNTFPAEALPASGSLLRVAGVPFRFPCKEDGQRNNVCCCKQVVAVPPAYYGAQRIWSTCNIPAGEATTSGCVSLISGRRHPPVLGK